MFTVYRAGIQMFSVTNCEAGDDNGLSRVRGDTWLLNHIPTM